MRFLWMVGVGSVCILLPILMLAERSESGGTPIPSTKPEEHLYTGELPELSAASNFPESPVLPQTVFRPISLPTLFPGLDAKAEAFKCAGGCSLDKHPKSFLAVEKYRELLKAFALEDITKESSSLDELLFHDVQVRDYLASERSNFIDDKHLSFLKSEIARTHVFLSARIIDEHGVVRGEKLNTRVPLEEKQHLHFEKRVRLQGFSVNGTVKRVGLHYLWSRW